MYFSSVLNFAGMRSGITDHIEISGKSPWRQKYKHMCVCLWAWVAVCLLMLWYVWACGCQCLSAHGICVCIWLICMCVARNHLNNLWVIHPAEQLTSSITADLLKQSHLLTFHSLPPPSSFSNQNLLSNGHVTYISMALFVIYLVA